MIPKYLLDTNIISEPLKPSPNAQVLNRLDRFGAHAAIASITCFELTFGLARMVPSARRDRLAAYLRDAVASAFEILPFDQTAAAWHGHERARLQALGLQTDLSDGQIAAIAATQGLILVTRNVAHFSPFSGLEIENWFDLS